MSNLEHVEPCNSHCMLACFSEASWTQNYLCKMQHVNIIELNLGELGWTKFNFLESFWICVGILLESSYPPWPWRLLEALCRKVPRSKIGRWTARNSKNVRDASSIIWPFFPDFCIFSIYVFAERRIIVWHFVWNICCRLGIWPMRWGRNAAQDPTKVDLRILLQNLKYRSVIFTRKCSIQEDDKGRRILNIVFRVKMCTRCTRCTRCSSFLEQKPCTHCTRLQSSWGFKWLKNIGRMFILISECFTDFSWTCTGLRWQWNHMQEIGNDGKLSQVNGFLAISLLYRIVADRRQDTDEMSIMSPWNIWHSRTCPDLFS